ncbi:MAG: methionine gamma-lyase family protein, partial [Clostridia bacterium]|nr:methionine gamma-lyase family protein [Clostridia bacterium]
MDDKNLIFNELGVSDKVIEYGESVLAKLEKRFKAIDDIAERNQAKVLLAMRKNRVSAACFAGSTGYGYDDAGRDTLE